MQFCKQNTDLRKYSNQNYIASGDANGKITCWVLPDGSGTEIQFAMSDSCHGCDANFAVLGKMSLKLAIIRVCFN
jgi:hypothetical protein